MRDIDYQSVAESVIEDNRYLALATTDGTAPWVATIEYIGGENGTFYFFSTTDSRHAEHIDQHSTVAVAIWGPDQPEYTPETSTVMRGVQIEGEAHRIPPDDRPEAVRGAIEALKPPMPPYAAYEIVAERVYTPVLEDGVNKRVEVELG